MMAVPSRLTVIALGLLGLVNLGRGGIHLFAPDGGAVSIAGLDISPAPEAILFLFATLGVGQIAMGLIDLAVATRFRAFAPTLLVIHVIQLALAVLAIYLLKPPPVPVPGQVFNLAIFVLLTALAAYEFLRGRRA